MRKLQSHTWYNDLEIEVKNVSTKPIYFILAYLDFPDVSVPANGVLGIPLHFGFNDNIDIRRIADPQDLHLNPGDTYIFVIPEGAREGLKERSPEALPFKKLELHFGVINFGDGTSFHVERLMDLRLKRSDLKKHHPSNRFRRSAPAGSSPQDGCGSCGRYVISGNHYPTCYNCLGNPNDHATTSPELPCRRIGRKFGK